MNSDNGTNFIGVHVELQKIYKLHATSMFKDAIQNYTTSESFEWNLNPPLSPHFGGLREAAVKSFRHHLYRIMKDKTLAYEQSNYY